MVLAHSSESPQWNNIQITKGVINTLHYLTSSQCFGSVHGETVSFNVSLVSKSNCQVIKVRRPLITAVATS